MLDEATNLAREYAGTSLYRALHARVQKDLTDANAKPATDPYEVMKLRGIVEYATKLCSVGFLITLASDSILQKEHAEQAQRPTAHPGEPEWFDLEPREPANDLVN